jgi:hypothetical protein
VKYISATSVAAIKRSVAGEDGVTRQFPTVGAALSAWAQWRDDGVSVKSTSDPSRFDAVPGGRRRLFDGRENLLEVELAFDRACEEHPAGAKVARACVLLFVVGSVSRRRIGLPEHKRKGTFVERVQCSAEQIQQACDEMGHGEKALRRYGREVVAAMGEMLGYKKVTRERRAEKEVESMSKFNELRGFDLEGLSAIARHLQVGSTKLRKLRELGLPVRTSIVGGHIANGAELTAWVDAFDRAQKSA